jgi:hypothetical protein
MLQNKDWDYGHRMNDTTYAGLSYDYVLVNMHGAHFHFWVPKVPTFKELLEKAKRECKNDRDMVSCSWDFEP